MSNELGVYVAINAIQAAISKTGIGKDRSNAQQGYKFRGIDDVYNALSSLLAHHGLCVIPRMISRRCTERVSAKGSALFYVDVEAEFDLVATADGSRTVARTYGEAMDSADKATNKAMSAAYKYAMLQLFAIPTEGDNDADAHTPEVLQVPPELLAAGQKAAKAGTARYADWWKSLTKDQRIIMRFHHDEMKASAANVDQPIVLESE